MSGSRLEVPEDLLRAVYAHAAQGWPEEVCGMLLGPKGETRVDEARRCANEQNRLHAEDPKAFPRDARSAYNLGPKDLFFVERSLRGDRPVKVVYHSHVDVGAYFSDEDERAALAGGDEPAYPVAWLVVDARKDGARAAKLFAWSGRGFEAVAEYGSLP
ncbi:MAG: Mov34/MPN/PAD-1 family protein [Myxococcota bacterium]